MASCLKQPLILVPRVNAYDRFDCSLFIVKTDVDLQGSWITHVQKILKTDWI
jgi:hypothetical protein